MYIKRGYAWRVESNPLSKQHVRHFKIDVGASNVQWVLEIPVYNQNIYQIRLNLKNNSFKGVFTMWGLNLGNIWLLYELNFFF